MAFPIGAALGAGASIIGGLMDSSSQSRENARARQWTSPSNIRKEAEKAGFNPLLFAPQAFSSSGAGFQPVMGSALSRAGAFIADGMDETRRLEIEQSRLQQERDQFERIAQQAILAPNVPGIYGPGHGGSRPTAGQSDPDVPVHRLQPVGSDLRVRPVDTDQYAGRSDVEDELRNVPPTAAESNAPRTYNPNTAPRFTALGIDFMGSGRFSSGEVYEDSLGDNPFTWLASPAIAADAVGYTAGRHLAKKRESRFFDELWYRKRYGLSHDDPLPYGWRSGNSPLDLQRGALKPPQLNYAPGGRPADR